MQPVSFGDPWPLACYPLTLHSDEHIFPFLPCLLLLFFSQLLVRPPQTAVLPLCISFSLTTQPGGGCKHPPNGDVACTHFRSSSLTKATGHVQTAQGCSQTRTCLPGYFTVFSERSGLLGFPYSSSGEESTCNTGDPGSILGSRRSPGEGNGNSLQCSCLENSVDGGTWWTTVHGVAESDTTERLTCTRLYVCMHARTHTHTCTHTRVTGNPQNQNTSFSF